VKHTTNHTNEEIMQKKRNYVSAHNKETCMSLIAVFMFPCANEELLNHINVQIFKKKVLKAELNKTKN
jgi:hypothetical protein